MQTCVSCLFTFFHVYFLISVLQTPHPLNAVQSHNPMQHSMRGPPSTQRLHHNAPPLPCRPTPSQQSSAPSRHMTTEMTFNPSPGNMEGQSSADVREASLDVSSDWLVDTNYYYYFRDINRDIDVIVFPPPAAARPDESRWSSVIPGSSWASQQQQRRPAVSLREQLRPIHPRLAAPPYLTNTNALTVVSSSCTDFKTSVNRPQRLCYTQSFIRFRS